MARSIPLGNEGNIPRGRLIFLALSSQKQRGHSRKRLRVEGDNLIKLIFRLTGNIKNNQAKSKKNGPFSFIHTFFTRSPQHNHNILTCQDYLILNIVFFC
jgi:hypothetical protein